MKRILGLVMACTLSLAAGISVAQVAGKTTVGVTVVQTQALMLGWSAKKDLLNKAIENDKKEKIGTVEDLIITPDNSVSAAIISTGGFVGMGTHDVAIPTTQLKYRDGKFMLPGATKEALKSLPAFQYIDNKDKPGT